MSWEYNAIYDSSQDGEDIYFLEQRMIEVKEEVLSKLTDLEISAIFENLNNFTVFYKQELEEQSLQYRIY
jgi:hypothetical protein